MNFMNSNTYNNGWVTLEVSTLNHSENVQSTAFKQINDKNEILSSLSHLFVEHANCRYLISNMVESMGEPKKTTFDIIHIDDGSTLGALILYGDDEISQITSSTVFTGMQQINDADDIHNIIRQSLIPCCHSLPTHSKLLMDNFDENDAYVEEIIDNIKIELGYAKTDPMFDVGIFTQQIMFIDDNPSTQITDLDKTQDNFVYDSAISPVNDKIVGLPEPKPSKDYSFVLLGILVLGIITGLIIWKIKQRKSTC